MNSYHWQIWIDTGGTFTDCIGIDSEGNRHTVKVLSNSSLRGKVVEALDTAKFRISTDWEAPDNFIQGFRLNLLGIKHPKCRITAFDAAADTIEIDTYIEELESVSEVSFEVQSPYEAPILAARLLTQTGPEEDLPPVRLRLATTKGTNALLERKGAPTMLLVTRGFGDLMLIGNQQRPDLFAQHVEKAPPLYDSVVEVAERLDADGNMISEISLTELEEPVLQFLKRQNASIAVCLMHSYKNPVHEQSLKKWLESLGADYISVSSELAPFIKILPRAQTTLVNATLQPVLQQYLTAVAEEIENGKIHVMTSAGGLVNTDHFHPKDSLLSGPAGGVVGASTIGKQNGFSNIISFDMGGTSTDVARYSEGYDYVFEHTVGEATLNAPALSIETVAAGGGSICSFDGTKLTVGPESAGAYPGPACYGAGGPLTLTDINLLLGRLDEENFGIPVHRNASRQKFEELMQKIAKSGNSQPDAGEIMEGFLQIANERMAETIRKISLRKGYDPSDYALVGFGGAGAQHICTIASEIGISDILIPLDAGLLSAYGLGHALIEQFAEKQVLKLLSETEADLNADFTELEQEARQKLLEIEEVSRDIQIREKLVFMRLKGQDSTLEVNFSSELKQDFREAYEQRYGHWIEGREIEIESIRVVASTHTPHYEAQHASADSQAPEPFKEKKIRFKGADMDTPVYRRGQIYPGQKLEGPALILDPYSTIVIESGWKAAVQKDGTLHISEVKATQTEEHSRTTRNKAVALELFTNRFTSIAEEMGAMLKRTALSVNVKERMDYSCALLNAAGELVVNAPHIPVHLGALGLCVKKLKDTIKMEPGDVVVTNHPAFGGSHLPDITVVTPIFNVKDHLIGFAASRAHHAEIGGTRPGSMPPDATTLLEEGVVIPPMYLVQGGEEKWEDIRRHLTGAPFPTRSIEENMADLQAAVAANHRGADALRLLAMQHGSQTIEHFMHEIKKAASFKCRDMLKRMSDMQRTVREKLDDGSVLKAQLNKQGDTLSIDFTGTSATHPGNLNATPAIVNSVIMYVLRLLIDEPLPLNEGLLEPVTIHLSDCLLNPTFMKDPKDCPAVVGGNTETSQRLTDLLLKPFEVLACSQGTMNNVLFGSDRFGYYETIGGGTGAGPHFDGSDAVHHHMTNTAGTDPEILEHRYPVRLERYEIRADSGGAGLHPGGNGIERELTFLESVSLSVLTQHRKEAPYGQQGGGPGKTGSQFVVRKNGSREALDSIDGSEVEEGDRFIIRTPGGGGYGKE